ncbi:class I adenylate-forming enzyme family protein [Sneathiella glossodoripedis]|uniref:class I adenylate-forming enzyme family protein n=1 Tax=Sneathiella glossodoripedis TaxID=418853 RepID=UPI00046FEC08|nr:class I adenylate-forming enzyme family protein [Sneathiella glossodoripedis]
MLFNNFNQLGRLTTTNSDNWTNRAEFQSRISERTEELSNMVSAGEKVLICHGGSAGFIVDLFSCWNLGVAAACINPTTTENEKQNIIEFIKPAAVLEAADSEPKATPHAGATKPTNLSLDLPALYLFTSGTTGTPKGVEHSFRSILARLTLNQTYIGLDSLKTTLCPLPTHFGHGLIGNLLTPLLGGCDVILLDDKSPMGVAKLGELIDQYEVTFLSSVPSFWKLATRLSKKPQKNSLKRVHVGSAPLSTDLWKSIANWCGTEDVFNMYGITETCNWIGGVSLKDGLAVDGRIGTVWGGSALVKNAETGHITAVGEGELLIQTPSLMNGYYNQPDLTSAVLKDGWFHTGDIGLITEDGDIRITGRQKSEINRAGIKILPEEIDLLLERHEDVQEVCVFGIPDEISGEKVAAAVVQKDGCDLSGDALSKWMQNLIKREAIPETWFFVNEIPKTDRGKINRDNVREVCLKEGKS